MRVGQARKRDANEKAIVDALQAVGATIVKLSGKGCPDLLVCFRGVWTPLEVKNRAGKDKLTTAQRDLQAIATFAVARTVDEALQVIGAARPVKAKA